MDLKRKLCIKVFHQNTKLWIGKLKLSLKIAKKCKIYLPSQAQESNLPIIANFPTQKISSDLFDLNGTPCLVIADIYSCMVWVEKVPGQSSKSIINVLLKLIQNLGFCNFFISDNGPGYKSAI